MAECLAEHAKFGGRSIFSGVIWQLASFSWSDFRPNWQLGVNGHNFG